jgi:hypothetical protein
MADHFAYQQRWRAALKRGSMVLTRP